MKIMLGCVVTFLIVAICGCSALAQPSEERPSLPNVLWLSTEDIGPELPCYGDTTATTPRLDALAAQGLTYDIAWSNYPVCAPARTTIISGMYSGTLGAGNMRSQVRLPANIKLFPQYLREAGYYCTNNSGQPFFAVINHNGTHEGKIRTRPHKAVIDPATVKLPSYWPDVPEVRQDLAQYYDNLTRMDVWIAEELRKLEDEGVADNTIVVFFGIMAAGCLGINGMWAIRGCVCRLWFTFQKNYVANSRHTSIRLVVVRNGQLDLLTSLQQCSALPVLKHRSSCKDTPF